MEYSSIKKNAVGFQTSHGTKATSSASSAPEAPTVRARSTSMSPAQVKLYGSLTADQGFSLADARRQFLAAGNASGSKK